MQSVTAATLNYWRRRSGAASLRRPMLGWCQEIWRRIRLEFTIEASCGCLVSCSQHCRTEWQLGARGGGLLTCLPCVLPAGDLHWGATQALRSTLQGSSLEVTAIMTCPFRPARPLQAGCQAQLPTWSAACSLVHLAACSSRCCGIDGSSYYSAHAFSMCMAWPHNWHTEFTSR